MLGRVDFVYPALSTEQATFINEDYNMASDGNAFVILPNPQDENLTTPAVTTFLETH